MYPQLKYALCKQKKKKEREKAFWPKSFCDPTLVTMLILEQVSNE